MYVSYNIFPLFPLLENSKLGNIQQYRLIAVYSQVSSHRFRDLTYSRWTSSLPSCLWSQRILPSLPGSRLTIFLSRCKFSTLTTRQPMVEFYLLAFPRFPLRKKEHKSYKGKNRTHDFRTSRYAGYPQDHSGDERCSHEWPYVDSRSDRRQWQPCCVTRSLLFCPPLRASLQRRRRCDTSAARLDVRRKRQGVSGVRPCPNPSRGSWRVFTQSQSGDWRALFGIAFV